MGWWPQILNVVFKWNRFITAKYVCHSLFSVVFLVTLQSVLRSSLLALEKYQQSSQAVKPSFVRNCIDEYQGSALQSLPSSFSTQKSLPTPVKA